MSSFMVSYDTLSRIAKNLVTAFDDERFARVSNYLYTGSLEKLFDDCHDKNFNYDTAKVAEKLFNMNRDALIDKYGSSASYMYSPFKYNPNVPNETKLFRQAKAMDDKNCYAKLVPLYTSLKCYLYQCSEGNVMLTALYQEMTNMKHRLGDLIIESTPAYDFDYYC